MSLYLRAPLNNLAKIKIFGLRVRRLKRSENDSERSETPQHGAKMVRSAAKMVENGAKTIQNVAIGIGCRPGMASASAIESLLGGEGAMCRLFPTNIKW